MEEEIRPPRIVIGLTGPVGSGCTTIANLFDDLNSSNRKSGNEFLKQLINAKYIKCFNDSYEVNWEPINKKVDEKLIKYHTIKHELSSNGTDVSGTKSLEKESVSVYKELGRLLELRESLKIFPFLKPYYTESSHLFRTLSMSDLILFHALMAVENGERSEIEPFNKLAKTSIENILSGMKEIGLDYNSISQYYKPEPDDTMSRIRAFKIIHDEAEELKKKLRIDTEINYPKILQDFGDNIRNCGIPFNCTTEKKATCNSATLARDMASIIKMIYQSREASFFIIDCLRNPYEILYLRKTFPDFYLVSIFAEQEVRFQRSFRKQVDSVGKVDEDKAHEQFLIDDRRDSGKTITNNTEKAYKQNVSKCVQISDFAVNNNKDCLSGDTELHEKMLRMLALILSPGSSKPKLDEVFMNMAYAMSVKSNCISRQVGAVIKGPKGYIVGAGWNDIASGEISCGLTSVRDIESSPFHEPIEQAISEGKWSEKYGNINQQSCLCFKDEMAKIVIPDKLNREIESGEYPQEALKHKETYSDAVRNSGLHQLEYCRALHAEENAILQTPKIGGPGIKGGTIYSTAEPCTLCAKKIKQSGLKRVVYTEPYPKSLPDVFMNGIKQEQFEGVKPRSYMRLFMANHDQKEWQDMEANNKIPGFDFENNKYLYELG